MARAAETLTGARPELGAHVEDEAAPAAASAPAPATETGSGSPTVEVTRRVVEKVAKPLAHRTEQVVRRTTDPVAPLSGKAVATVTAARAEASDPVRHRVERAWTFLIDPLGHLPAVHLLPVEDVQAADPSAGPRSTYAGTDDARDADDDTGAGVPGGSSTPQPLAEPGPAPLAEAAPLAGTMPAASVPTVHGEFLAVSHPPPIRTPMAPECPASTSGAPGSGHGLAEALGAVTHHPHVATTSAPAAYDFLPPRERASSPSASPD